MDAQQLGSLLQHPQQARDWFRSLGIENFARGSSNLEGLAKLPIPSDLLSVIVRQISETLPTLSDPDMALNNLERFFAAARNPLALGSLFERDREALPHLLQIFCTSQYLSDLLIRDPRELRPVATDRGPAGRSQRLGGRDLQRKPTSVATNGRSWRCCAVTSTARRCGSLTATSFGISALATVTEQISYLADAHLRSRLPFAFRRWSRSGGVPLAPTARPRGSSCWRSANSAASS